MQLFNQRKRTLWMLAAAIAIIALGVLGYLYRTRLKLGWALLVEETGSRSAAAVCMVLGLFALVCLIVWMVFPILVYLGLKDLQRHTSELNESTKSCARHLAQLTDGHNWPLENKVRDQPSPRTDRDTP